MTIDWNDLQTKHQAWSVRNFGDRGPIQGALGINEEVGELTHAIEVNDAAEVRDAIGDITLFTIEYVSKRQWKMLEVIAPTQARFLKLKPHPGIVVSAGRIAHAELKLWQGIRGYEGHASKALEAARDLMRYLPVFTDAYFPSGPSYENIVIETWSTVSQRDWVKDRDAGGGER
jgi:NTP pyrophosphatase (non-canonical NTP hydrolase)